ncbi:CBM35 domain-containing protein [Streptomyces lactacystinicus]
MGEQTTVTTAGSNGVPEGQGGGAPQDDDPFGYLYRPADGSTGQPAEPQQGVPRTSYNRPMEVGRAQYGYPQRAQQQQQQPYGQQGMPPQGYPGGQPQAPYGGQPGSPQQPEYGAAPTQQTRYAEHSRPQPGEEPRSSGRSKGAVIGAVAVVAAIAIGAGIALSTGDPDDTKNTKGGAATTAPPAPNSPAPTATNASAGPTSSATAISGPTSVDAGQLQAQNAPSGNSVKGAKSADGSYLTLQPGGSVTWTGDIATAGTYKLSVHYNYSGADIKGGAAVNGKDWPSGVTYKIYGAPPKDQTAAWFSTWILPQFQAGPNSVTFTVPSGPILIDQITIEPSG